MSKDGRRGVSGFVSQRLLFRTQQTDNFRSFGSNNWAENLGLIKANSRGGRFMLNGLELRVLQSVAVKSIHDGFAVEEMAGMQWLWLLRPTTSFCACAPQQTAVGRAVTAPWHPGLWVTEEFLRLQYTGGSPPVWLWCPSLRSKELPRIRKCSWAKRAVKARGSANNQKVLSVNCTLGMEIGVLVPGLLYKHMVCVWDKGVG